MSSAVVERDRTEPSGGAGAGRRGRAGLRRPGFGWILPALVVSVGIIYYSIGYTGYMSGLDWNGVSADRETIGADNYAELFQDRVFWLTVRNTMVLFTIAFAVQTVLGIAFGALLHSKVWFGTFYKVIIFVPAIIAPATMAPVFRLIFSSSGPFNSMLEFLGLGAFAQPWLGQSSTALWIIILIQIWHGTGISFILYYAAMGQIDSETLEAARIDGAGNIRVLWSIILPTLRGTVVVLAMLTAIASLKLFDIPFLVTLGGPNFASEFLGTFIFRQTIPLGRVGYGAAASVVVLVVALAIAFLINRTRTRDENGAP